MIKAKVIWSSILFSGECLDTCSISLPIAFNHKKSYPLGRWPAPLCQKIFQCNYPIWTKEKLFSHATSVGNKRKWKTENLLLYPILCPLCQLHQRKQIKMKFLSIRIYFNVVWQVHIVAKKVFYKTCTFDCSRPQYRGQMVCQTMHCSNKTISKALR